MGTGKKPGEKDANDKEDEGFADWKTPASASDRQKLEEAFAPALMRYLRGEHKEKKDLFQEMKQTLAADKPFHGRYFDDLLRLLFDSGSLALVSRRIYDREQELHKRFEDLQEVIVVAGSLEEHFAKVAADFIRQLPRIAEFKKKNQPDGTINVGIVSGTTCQSVIGACVHSKSWQADFGVDATKLPNIRIFALNVCLTVPQHLGGNSTILAWQLSDKIQFEGRDKSRAKAYGLTARRWPLKKTSSRRSTSSLRPSTSSSTPSLTASPPSSTVRGGSSRTTRTSTSS